jgi:hypothetical protein
MRFVHKTENDFGAALIFGSQLCPQISELGVSWSVRALPNDISVEARKVV